MRLQEHIDGGQYRGEWKGMLKDGLGAYTYPSGARYEGERLGSRRAGLLCMVRGMWQGGVLSAAQGPLLQRYDCCVDRLDCHALVRRVLCSDRPSDAPVNDVCGQASGATT